MVAPLRIKKIGPSRQRRNDKRNEEMRFGKALDPNWSRKMHSGKEAAKTVSEPEKLKDETKTPVEDSVLPSSSYPLSNGAISVSIWKFHKFRQLEEVFHDLGELLKLDGNHDLQKLEILLKDFKLYQRPSVVSRLKLVNSFKQVDTSLDKSLVETCKLSIERCQTFLKDSSTSENEETEDLAELTQFVKNFIPLRDKMKENCTQFMVDLKSLWTMFRDVKESKSIGMIPDLDASSDKFLNLLVSINLHDQERKMISLAKYLTSKVSSFISSLEEANIIVESMPMPSKLRLDSMVKAKEVAVQAQMENDSERTNSSRQRDREGEQSTENHSKAETVSPAPLDKLESEIVVEVDIKLEEDVSDQRVEDIDEKHGGNSIVKEHNDDILIPLASSSPKECNPKVFSNCGGQRVDSAMSARYKISTVSEMLEFEFGKIASDKLVKLFRDFDDGEGNVPASEVEDILVKYSYLLT